MLRGKVALVTGAGYGVGASVALGFAEAGANIAVHDRKRNLAVSTWEEIEKHGAPAIVNSGDVAEVGVAESIVENVVEEFGRIDILVNTGGVGGRRPLVEMDDDEWWRVLNANLTTVFRMTRAAAPHMSEQGSGRVINISSAAARVPVAGAAHSCAASAGVIGFTRAVAKELAPRGVLVNAILLGRMRRPILEGGEDYGTFLNEPDSIPLGRFGEPEDIVGLSLFLASEQSRYMTGQTFNVDGGLVMQ